MTPPPHLLPTECFAEHIINVQLWCQDCWGNLLWLEAWNYDYAQLFCCLRAPMNNNHQLPFLLNHIHHRWVNYFLKFLTIHSLSQAYNVQKWWLESIYWKKGEEFLLLPHLPLRGYVRLLWRCMLLRTCSHSPLPPLHFLCSLFQQSSRLQGHLHHPPHIPPKCRWNLQLSTMNGYFWAWPYWNLSWSLFLHANLPFHVTKSDSL